MRTILQRDFFHAAPRFRRHEAFVGVRWHAKSNADEPGLWIATVPERMEIATQISYDYDEAISRASAMAHYRFSTVLVQPGDAVVDYDAFFENDEGVQPAGRIRFRIPKDEFLSNYVYDETRRDYRLKPYAVVFSGDPCFLKLEDGGIEAVNRHTVVKLDRGQVTMEPISVFSGEDERLICGQPLNFYADMVPGQHPHFYMRMWANGGLGLSIGPDKKTGQYPNPYAHIKSTYDRAAQAFDEHPVLSQEQRGEFDVHRADIGRRHAFFEEFMAQRP